MKYVLRVDLPSVKLVDGRILYQIQRVSDMTLGGFIEKESNLSQEGACWVADNAWVYGYATVRDDAQVYENALIFGNAQIFGKALVHGNAIIGGFVQIYDSAEVAGDAVLRQTEMMHENAKMFYNLRQGFGQHQEIIRNDFANYKSQLRLS